MRRREFLGSSWAAVARGPEQIGVAWYRRARKYSDLPVGRVAFVERGRGRAALFLHGFPLNGYQRRGALARLHLYRRCIAPDMLGLGYTQARSGQTISPDTQTEMLA